MASKEKLADNVVRPNRYIDTSPFWTAAAEHRLVLQVCRDTNRLQHVPRPVSLYTGSRNLGWREVSGAGSVHSWTTIFPPEPSLAGRSPLVAVLVDLEEGVRMLSWLSGTEPAEVTAALRVRVDWQQLTDGRIWPAFAPA